MSSALLSEKEWRLVELVYERPGEEFPSSQLRHKYNHRYPPRFLGFKLSTDVFGLDPTDLYRMMNHLEELGYIIGRRGIDAGGIVRFYRAGRLSKPRR